MLKAATGSICSGQQCLGQRRVVLRPFQSSQRSRTGGLRTHVEVRAEDDPNKVAENETRFRAFRTAPSYISCQGWTPLAHGGKLKERLSKQGLNKETAQRALKLWESQSATDADSLKKLLRRRSLAVAGRISIQIALDIVAAVGAYNLSAVLGAQEGLPLKWLWSGLTAFLGSYFAVGVLLDFFSIGALAVSSLQFQTDSAAFIGAVKELAGEGTGINVVDKAAQARNTLKVLSALNNISKLLQEEGTKAGQESTLSDLSTYLLLNQAKEAYGWDYDKEGLTYQDAGIIAKVFSRFDTNDDGKLDLSEIKALARDLDQDLNEEDVKEAFQVLDTDNSRAIEFPEFVKLYQDKIQKPDEVLTPK